MVFEQKMMYLPEKHILEAWKIIFIPPAEPVLFLVGELLDSEFDLY